MVILLVALLATASAALAQRTTGSISGTVTDSTGGVLPGVNVSAVCTETNQTRVVVTDTQGGFNVPELPVCLYRVTAELPGFKTIARDAPVVANGVAKVDFKLEVGAQSETITVEASSAVVEFSDKLNNRVDAKRIESIPLSGRDFNSLLSVTPGVQHQPGGGFLGVNVSGARTTSNNYMIDGISNNDRYYGDSVMNQTGVVGVPATLVPMDAIGDFTVQQTPSAEFGVKGGAAINVVMKSGGNVPHGSGYYFRHDTWSDSPNYFTKQNAILNNQAVKSTDVKNQQYGGTFGGPIKKDKAFFFGYYEGQRLDVPSTYNVHVPTTSQIADARLRIARAGMQVNPIGENLLKFFPTDPSGNMNVGSPNISNMSTFSIKVDHNLNAKNMINERLFWGTNLQSAPAFNTGEIVAPGQPNDFFNSVADPTRVYLVGVVWNSTLASSTLLETRLGFSSISQTIDVNNKIDPKSLGVNTGPLDSLDFGVPSVQVGSFGHIGGVGGYPITTDPTTTTQVTTSLTHTRGSQTFKMGGSFDYAYNRSVRNRSRPTFNVTAGTSDDVDSLVGLLLGRIDGIGRSFGSTERFMHQNSYGMFFNDDWRVNARLTLSGGLRYEIFSPVVERSNLASNFLPDRGLVRVGTSGLDSLYNTQKKNFGPRAGLAWDVTGSGRTSLRAGYALTYDSPQIATLHSPGASRAGSFTNFDTGVFSVTLSGALNRLPDDRLATCFDPNNSTAGGDYVCLQPGASAFGSSPSGSPPFDVFGVPTDIKAPLYHYFHVTFQHELFRNNAVTISYVGSRGYDQIIPRDINAPPLGSAFTGNIDRLRPYNSQYPNLRHIYMLTNDGRSWYDSVQFSYRQSNWHGINTQYNYTLSDCQDYNSGNRDGVPQAVNPWNPANNKGPCNADIRHNFNVGGSYALPESSKLGPVGRGWEVGTVFSALSGRPFTPTVGARDNSGQNIGTLRANCNGDPQYGLQFLTTGSASGSEQFILNLPTTSQRLTNDSSLLFSTPANGTLGNCGRNSLRRPIFAAWDLNILRTFKLQGSARVQARFEIFNLLNRVNLGAQQSSNVRSGLFGTIGSTPDVDRGNPVIASGGPRAMQWALKVLF